MPSTSTLSAKQTRFVTEYLVDSNGAAAAVRAGYAPGSAKVIACRLTKDNRIQEVLRAQQSADATRLGLRRQEVLAGLLEAIDQARAQCNPMGMIAGFREIGKLLGLYEPELKKVDLNVEGSDLMDRIASMSDAELAAIVEARQVA